MYVDNFIMHSGFVITRYSSTPNFVSMRKGRWICDRTTVLNDCCEGEEEVKPATAGFLTTHLTHYKCA